MLKQPVGLPEGIYFQMDNREYHLDPAISRSNIVKLLISPYDFWENSSLNPEYDILPPTSQYMPKAMKFGILSEFYLLDERRFRQTYNIAGGDYHQGRVTLEHWLYDDIVQSANTLRRDPKIKAMLSDGYPSVAIFYRDPESGLMLKIMADLMRTFGCVDLKRLKSLEISKLGWFINDHGYHIQEAMSRDAVTYAKQRLRAGTFPVKGKVDKAWLKRFIDDPDADFRFLMQRSTAPYIYRVEKMSPQILRTARNRMKLGLGRYIEAVNKYGTTKAWPGGSSECHEFQEINLPMRSFDEGE